MKRNYLQTLVKGQHLTVRGRLLVFALVEAVILTLTTPINNRTLAQILASLICLNSS